MGAWRIMISIPAYDVVSAHDSSKTQDHGSCPTFRLNCLLIRQQSFNSLRAQPTGILIVAISVAEMNQIEARCYGLRAITYLF